MAEKLPVFYSYFEVGRRRRRSRPIGADFGVAFEIQKCRGVNAISKMGRHVQIGPVLRELGPEFGQVKKS